MNTIRHLDLFSGIGGFSLAARNVWGAEHKVVAFCEIDSFCQKVLKKHWPKVPIVEDIRNVKGQEYKPIELVSGGFPCQPFSVAGKQRSKDDNRYLWPQMLRIIEETQPKWIVCENVFGIINLALDDVLASLEMADYSTESFIIPACTVNAWHRRDRVWIIAYSNSYFDSLETESKQWRLSSELCRSDVREIWNRRYKSELYRATNGIPSKLDKHRRKALGNAIVPQIAEVIFRAIKSVKEQKQGQQPLFPIDK